MTDPDQLNDLHFLRDVVSRTHPPSVNHFWPITLMWGCVVAAGYLTCTLLGIAGKLTLIPWIMPTLIFLVGWPLHLHLRRKVLSGMEEQGARPRYRKDLMWCWMSIYGMGLLWTAGLVISGLAVSQGYLLIFAWCSLLFVGYIMNAVLLSKEWWWAAAILPASLIAACLAGFFQKQPAFYWLPGYWIPGTFLLAGILGRRNARRQMIHE